MKKKICGFIAIIFALGTIFFGRDIKEEFINLYIQREFDKNSITLDFKENENELMKGLKDDIENNEIFLVGEFHAVKKSMELNLEFLKFFVENADVRYILFESGYTTAQLLNEFLETGDYEILEFIMSSLHGTFGYTEENHELLSGIYEFNKTLPDDKKLSFVGVDIEHQPNIALRYINSLVPKEEVPKEIEEYFNLLGKTTMSNFLVNAKKISSGIEENKHIFEEYLGDNFFDFSFSINNLSISIPGMALREKYIKNNFKVLYERLPKGKYFGQFGNMHVMKSGVMDESDPVTLANFLENEYENTKGKVVTMLSALNNSYNMTPQNHNNGPINTLPEEFFPAGGETTLVKLNYENSPFKKYRFLVKDAPTTEYYDYFILISNSQACRRYEMK